MSPATANTAESTASIQRRNLVYRAIIVFGGYAILFSTASMIALYTRLRRWIEAVLLAVFAVAGLKLLASQS